MTVAVVTPEELHRLARNVRDAHRLLHARTPTPAAGPVALRLQSRFRTSERTGTRRWRDGDSPGTIVWKELLLRDRVTVRTYRALAELNVCIICDGSRMLLADRQTGPLALKLAFGLAVAALAAKHATTVAVLGHPRPRASGRRLADAGRLIDYLSAARPVPLTPAAALPLLARALAGRRSNANVFAVLHAGYPLAEFDVALRMLRRQAAQTVVFQPVAAAHFDAPTEATDPDSGRRVGLPRDSIRSLVDHLNAGRELGRRLGVVVEPLVIEDHVADLETLLPLLGRMT